MKRFICIIITGFFLSFSLFLAAKEKEPVSAKGDKTKLVSDELESEGKALDEEIQSINNKINELIVNYKLLQIKDIRILPYRTTYNVGENYIEIEKYDLLRDSSVDDDIKGINRKKIKVFINGESISKIESVLTEQRLNIGATDRVIITDPSPVTPGTDDIVFSHISRNVKLIDNRKLGDVKNNRVSPLRNNIKKEFIIPHISFLYDTLLDIAETYYSGVKDSERNLSDFLKKSTEY
jgi:hypothetical protein